MNALQLNYEYLDLYGDSLLPYVEMPINSTFDDIKKQVATNNTVGYEHRLMVGRKCVIAERRFTWKGNVAKTSYLHILVVNNFDDKKVLTRWREQKDGSFKTI